MFIGLVFTILAGYMLIVTISYFANIGSDQSAMLNGDFDPTMIRNAGGPAGAWIAHTLLYNWLGIGSFLLIYYRPPADCQCCASTVRHSAADHAMPADSSGTFDCLRSGDI